MAPPPDGTGDAPDEGWSPPSTPPSSPPPPPSAPPPPPTAPPYGQQPPGGHGQQPYGQPQYAGYGQPPYGGQPYGAYPYASPKTEGTAIAALVCAIASFVVCIPILAIVAIPLASSAKRKIEQSNGMLTGENLLMPAKIVAWINLGLWAIFILFMVFALVIGGMSTDSTTQFERVAVAAAA
jgi:hypothetical protein